MFVFKSVHPNFHSYTDNEKSDPYLFCQGIPNKWWPPLLSCPMIRISCRWRLQHDKVRGWTHSHFQAMVGWPPLLAAASHLRFRHLSLSLSFEIRIRAATGFMVVYFWTIAFIVRVKSILWIHEQCINILFQDSQTYYSTLNAATNIYTELISLSPTISNRTKLIVKIEWIQIKKKFNCKFYVAIFKQINLANLLNSNCALYNSNCIHSTNLCIINPEFEGTLGIGAGQSYSRPSSRSNFL